MPVCWAASQLAQVVWESALNLATAQALHVVAPVLVSAFVTEPAGQGTQAVVEAELYFPASQAVQVLPLVAVNMSVTEPGAQAEHAVPSAPVVPLPDE